jgi:cholesterol oxidase
MDTPTTDGQPDNQSPGPSAGPAEQTATRFAIASCQYPAGVFDLVPARGSFDRLDKAVGNAPNSTAFQAILFLGDQIYADASYGILDPTSTFDRFNQTHDDWRSAVEGREHVRLLLQQNRIYVALDDHEIHDNWEPCPNDGNQQILHEAQAAYDSNVGFVLHPKRSPAGGYWGLVDIGGGHKAFMLDTRTTRERRFWGPGNAPGAAPHILNKAQRDALEVWLQDQRDTDSRTGVIRPKFISCAVWPLPRRVGRDPDPGMSDAAAARSDSWDGYPASLKWLLGFVVRQNIQGVVILCGDAHLAGYTEVRLWADSHHTLLRILHSPALYAPFPFANGLPHHYRRNDHLAWDEGGIQHTAHVHSELWPLGDGFVQVDVEPTAGGWKLAAQFHTSPTVGPICDWDIA